MIVDLVPPVVYPLYFINRRNCLFYSLQKVNGAYYIRLDSPTDWKCIHTDGLTITPLDPDTFAKAPEEIWKEIKLDDLEGVYKPTSEGDYMSRNFQISDKISREILLNGLVPGVPVKRKKKWSLIR